VATPSAPSGYADGVTLLLLLCGCGGPAPDGPDETGGPDGGTTDSSGTTDCAESPAPPEDPIEGAAPRPARVWSGSVTWTLDASLLAERAGFQDCTYTRRYDALVETTRHGWLCPECDLLLMGEGEVVSGYEDCYAQLSDGDAVRVESWGLAAVEGGSRLFRSGTQNVTLGEMATVAALPTDAVVEVEWAQSGLLELGMITLGAAGRFDATDSATAEVGDPQDPRDTPYACGWPRMNPGGPNSSWELADGQVFPNFQLEDQCGEPLSLWDLRGRYVVVDAASPDCGPCQLMAAAASDFERRMAAECLPVQTLTLLTEDLSAVNLPAALEDRQEWALAFDLDAPVLGDEGLGYALFPPYFGQSGGMSMPSWVVLAPDGTLIGGGTGFSEEEGGWSEMEQLIRAHAAR